MKEQSQNEMVSYLTVLVAFYDFSGSSEATTTLHVLGLLQEILDIVPKSSLKSACETILKVMTLANVVSYGAAVHVYVFFKICFTAKKHILVY